MSEGVVANEATVKALGARDGVVCVGVVLEKLMLDFEGQMKKEMDEKKIKEILVERHQFSMERVEKQIDKLKELKKEEGQKKLF